MAGYSGTPLAKKLGVKNTFKIKIVNPPDYYFKLFIDLPEDIKQIKDSTAKKDFIHYFANDAKVLYTDVKNLKKKLNRTE
jgi:hypothetical protein